MVASSSSISADRGPLGKLRASVTTATSGVVVDLDRMVALLTRIIAYRPYGISGGHGGIVG